VAIWLFGYLSLAFIKFVLLLPSAFEQAKFTSSLEGVESDVWMLCTLTVFAYEITSLLWPRLFHQERLQFFTYQPFDEDAKVEILKQLDE
jgi:hypothetical protein